MQIEQLFDFLHQSVSPFHAVHTAAQLLDAAGYTRLEEAEYWNLEPEHGYYVTRNESSIIACALFAGAPHLAAAGALLPAIPTPPPGASRTPT